jgi:SAM-dependent methyltransferase
MKRSSRTSGVEQAEAGLGNGRYIVNERQATARGVADGRIYFGDGYLNEGRFVDYYHTYRLARQTGGRRFLEIGPGNGLVAWLLRRGGASVTTLDIEPSVEPDVIGSVAALPFGDGAFDAVICCEVLEHLPWEFFPSCLQEIRRVGSGPCVLSLPHVGKTITILAELPFIGSLWGSLPLPPLRRPDMAQHPEHFWSVGSRGCSDRLVARRIRESGFRIVKSYRPGFNKAHKFYLLAGGAAG